MPERLRAHREGIDRLLQHVVAGVVGHDAAVSLDRDELRTLLDALPVAVLVSTDRACTRIWGNAAARQLYQLPDGQNFSVTSGAPAPFEVYANGKPADPSDLPLQKAARTGLPAPESECEIRFPDGRRIFIAGHSIPVRDSTGEVCGSVGAFLDLTPQRRELETLQIVSQEMSHRLKNTFSIVQSIAQKTLRPAIDRAVYAAFEDRLISLARYQDLLYRQDWKSAKLDQVVDLALDGLESDLANRVSAAGPEVTLPASSALTVSMILHELGTNALKHGALSSPAGRVAVAWESRIRGGCQELRLRWEETGGPPPAAHRGDGFGTGMMAYVARGLPRGRIELKYEPTGVCAVLAFQVDASGPERLA